MMTTPFSLFLGLTQSFKVLLAPVPFRALTPVLLLALLPLLSRQIYLQGLETNARRHTSFTVTVTFTDIRFQPLLGEVDTFSSSHIVQKSQFILTCPLKDVGNPAIAAVTSA